MTQPQFVIYSLPRSRSAWMSKFLSYGGLDVGHDIATQCQSIAEFRASLEPLAGTCETGAVLGWRVIKEEIPNAKLVVVKRDPREVYRSLAAFGIDADMDDLVNKYLLLDVVSHLDGVMTIEYDALRSPATCRDLFEFCLDLPFDWQWWEELNRTNIQVDMGLRLQQLIMNRGRIELLKAEVAERTEKLGGRYPCLH